MTVDEFGKAVAASGLLSVADLKALWGAVPAENARPKSDQGFAKLLVDQGKVTPFQAEEILSGSVTPLVLGDYVLLAKIGAGGMGQVFKAQHRRMKRVVAIKLLPTAMTKDADSIRRFEREVEAAARLVHPNIVAAYDAGEARGVHYLVMEYVDGRDLAHVVKAVGKLSVNQVTDYILQAARGLAYAHSEGVIHRDIKPANLLLDKKGVVKILDMGLARFESINPRGVEAKEGLTQSGQVMGTVDYMAPEQAFDTHRADARSDIYSLGCSMYRLLSGENVYGGESFVQKLLAHREKPVPDLCKLRPDVPRAVDAVFKKIMAKNPADRYQHAAELVAALEECRNPGATVSFSNADSSLAQGKLGDILSLSGLGLPSAMIGDDSPTAGIGGLLQEMVPSEQTLSNAGPESETDPKSETGMGAGGKKPPLKLIVAGGAGSLLILLLAIWVIVRDKDGKEVGRIELPSGGTVETRADAPPGNNANPNPLPVNVTTEVAGKSTGTGSTRRKKSWDDPAFKEWMKSVAELPAKEQVDAVSKKLVELNPGFDGKMDGLFGKNTKIEGEVVTEIAFVNENISDITPIRALPKLRSLYYSGGPGKFGKLADLSPLEGMPLKELTCSHNAISDLSPLKGMPLLYLHCGVTKVADLAPLEGMHLTALYVSDTLVSDLSPVKGMPLKMLNIFQSKISDLSPLEGMPLEIFTCDNTIVSDLSPLRAMTLRSIKLTPNRITKGIDVLREMKSIESILVENRNYRPAEFWAKYDAEEFSSAK